MAVYQFKPGSQLYGNAQAVGEALESIRTERLGLTPHAVVLRARHDDSPLHRYFEWDDHTAATRYRLDQAGHLIRCVTVSVDEPESQATVDGEPPPSVRVRAFVPVITRDGRGIFEATAVALTDADYRRQILERAHGELTAFRSKYKEIEELSAVFAAVDDVARMLTTDS